MIRALLVLVLLATVAHADPSDDAKRITDDAMARWNAAAGDRGPLARLWNLIDSSEWDKMERAKQDVLDMRADIDKKMKKGEPVDAELRVKDLQRRVDDMDREIGEWKSYWNKTRLTLVGGIVGFIILAFGAGIWRRIKNRR